MSEPRGLVWDIENSSFIGDFWSLYDVTPHHIRELPQVLTFAWHWIGDNDRKGNPRIYVKGQDDFKGYKPGVNDDYQLVKFAWDLLDEADFTVAHNGDKHDERVMNGRFMKHDLQPPAPHKQVDTKKIFSRAAGDKLGGNSLKNLSKQFGFEDKEETGGYATWLGCVAGDKKAWKMMKHYNKGDIPNLLKLYLKSRSWDKQGVPMNILLDKPDSCPSCGHEELRPGIKYTSTKTNKYQYYRCMECGSSVKVRIPEKITKPKFVK